MTAHECNDTAYQAAAMPDECTCDELVTPAGGVPSIYHSHAGGAVHNHRHYKTAEYAPSSVYVADGRHDATLYHSHESREPGTRWAAESVPAPEIWTTTVETVNTPRGLRYRGISYVGEGYPKNGPAPRGAEIRYTTRLHTQYNEAREQARGKTIHHNVFHDGNKAPYIREYHRGIRCGEGRPA